MADRGFSERKEYLIKAKEELQKRDDIASQVSQLKSQTKKLNRNIASEEKSIADEINSTIKKRRNEILSAYDGRLGENRAKKKSVASKRDKKKEQRMGDRFDRETKHIRQNDRELRAEMHSLLRQNRLPSFCGKKLYFVMFDANGMEEFGLKIIAFLVYFAGIPGILTLLFKAMFLNEKKDINVPFWCTLIAAIFVVIMLLVYFAIYNKTKHEHKEVLEQARSIQDKINANKRQTNAIRSSIHRDTDESQYNLGAFDEKLANLEQEADAINSEKQDALKTFEDETIKVITDEVNGRRLQGLEDMKQQRDKKEQELSQMESAYQEQLQLIAEQYATSLGNDLCRKDRLDILIKLMEDGEARTVSEAIAVLKG